MIDAWPRVEEDAVALQRELAAQVVIPDHSIAAPKNVVGLDVSYRKDSDHITAAAVVMDISDGRIIDQSIVTGTAEFPYIPGLLAFREVPILLEALAKLHTEPQLLLCDGQGIAHPRRCGVASHLGILTGLPALGCAKSWFIGEHDQPGSHRGDRSELRDSDELIGYVLRTQDGVKPVYVSPGHGINFDQSCDIVLTTAQRYRLPDPIRHADHLSRQALRS